MIELNKIINNRFVSKLMVDEKILIRKDTSLPKISIVTPSFNQVKHIEKTILSVLNQNYSNLEYIIIDGGSDDGSVEIIKKYAKYLAYWVSEKDKGMYDAINKGLKIASGNIMAYINTDDFYLPWTFDTIVDAFLNNPGVDLLYGDIIGINIEKNDKLLRFQSPFSLRYIRLMGFLPQPTVFWRNRVYNEIGGFDDSLKFIADCDYWMKTGSKYKIKKINEFIAVECDHAQTKRSSQMELLIKELVMVRKRYNKENKILKKTIGLIEYMKSFMWRRIYMMIFLLLYLNKGAAGKCPWINTIKTNNFKMIPLHKLLFSFIPNANKGVCKWNIISGFDFIDKV